MSNAARVGDPTEHNENLGTGPGATNVVVQGSKAWRASVDVHTCTEHQQEKAYIGSTTVLINGEMAVRKGDFVTSLNPPANAVKEGAPDVLIGDLGFGLLDPARAKAFCKDWCAFLKEWPNLNEGQRVARIQEIVNKHLEAAGVPPVTVISSDTPGAGQFSSKTWAIELDKEIMTRPTLDENFGVPLGGLVYHESRHAEQYYAATRYQASQRGMTKDTVSRGMVVPDSAAASAMNGRFRGSPTAESVFGKTMHHAYRDQAYRDYSDKTARDFFADQTKDDMKREYQAATPEVDAYRASALIDTPCNCKKLEEEEAAKAEAEAAAAAAAAAPAAAPAPAPGGTP
jgi:uncharacterized Zn-binding protein involved in type VI secretion